MTNKLGTARARIANILKLGGWWHYTTLASALDLNKGSVAQMLSLMVGKCQAHRLGQGTYSEGREPYKQGDV